MSLFGKDKEDAEASEAAAENEGAPAEAEDISAEDAGLAEEEAAALAAIEAEAANGDGEDEILGEPEEIAERPNLVSDLSPKRDASAPIEIEDEDDGEA